MSGNTFQNTGDFRGAALFQGSTVHNAGQIAGTLKRATRVSYGSPHPRGRRTWRITTDDLHAGGGVNRLLSPRHSIIRY